MPWHCCGEYAASSLVYLRHQPHSDIFVCPNACTLAPDNLANQAESRHANSATIHPGGKCHLSFEILPDGSMSPPSPWGMAYTFLSQEVTFCDSDSFFHKSHF